MYLVDIPGLEQGATAEGGRGSKLLTHIKEADVLIHVVRCFENGHEPIDALHDVELIDLELMAADSLTLQRKVERLAKRVRTGDKNAILESDQCQRVLAQLDEGIPARRQALSDVERDAVFECTLMSLKPVLYVANVDSRKELESDAVRVLREYGAKEGSEVVTICGRDEAEISELPAEDRHVFLQELGVGESSAERILRAAYQELRLADFFTAGEKEVRVWTCEKGSTAAVAAGKIHSDMERGFVRMEVIAYEDLVTYGSEAAAIQGGKRRLEGKDYCVQDGDVVVVRFSPPRR